MTREGFDNSLRILSQHLRNDTTNPDQEAIMRETDEFDGMTPSQLIEMYTAQGLDQNEAFRATCRILTGRTLRNEQSRGERE